MKKKLHYFDFEQKKLRKYPKSNDKHIDSCLLRKYFPKYIKEFFLANHNGAVKSKIKRAKIIRSFQTSRPLQNPSDWRVLLATKMKGMRTFKHTSHSTKQLADKLRFFSGLKSVQIFMFNLKPNPFRPPNKQKGLFLRRVLKNIGFVQNLEHLELSPVSIETKKYLPGLNSHQRLLDSLKTLKFFFEWKGATDAEISELIEKNKNLLKNVTSLELDLLHSPFHFESFKRLGELCHKILALSFKFSCQEPKYHHLFNMEFSYQRFEVKTNYLQTLGAFQNMRYLKLHIFDIFTFLKDLALPSSIQSLELIFEERLTRDIMRKIDNKFTDFFEEELPRTLEGNDILLRFYENFRSLKVLETLQLLFSLDSHEQAYKYQSYLSQSLLKRISSPLKSLKVLPTALSSGLFLVSISEMQDPYLSQLIKGCENFAPTLEVLELGSPKVIYSKFDLGIYENKFTKLSYIEIKANFQDSDIDTPGSLLKNLICLGKSIARIQVGFYMDPTVRSMLSLLQEIKQLQKPRSLKITIELYLKSPKEMVENFAGGIDELKSHQGKYSKPEGVFLKLVESYFTSQEMKTFCELYKERFHPL